MSLELCPRMISIRDLLIPKILDKSAITPALALPSVGGAVTLSRSVSPSHPSTWLREALGWTRILKVEFDSADFPFVVSIIGSKYMREV